MAKKSIKGFSLFLTAVLLFLSVAFIGTSAASASPSVLPSSLQVGIPLPTGAEQTQTSLCGASRTGSSYKNMKVYAGGVPFGVKFLTAGVLVVGFNDVACGRVTVNPARDAGLQCNDRLLTVNGIALSGAAELNELISASEGRPMQIRYARGGKEYSATLTPIWSETEGRYATGLYVRDSGAGIGTVTFIVPSTGAFAGLGHGICDGETGKLIPIDRGSVVNVTIKGVVRGLSGTPGEVRGYFSSGKIGTLLGNTECGVYGVLAELPSGLSEQTIPLGTRQDVREGKAVIRCTLDGNTCTEYDVEISEIQRDSTSNKCFTVKITDPDLIAKSGGIIQGMSGSPIIQNGKLVGAVTHVLINDPTCGYGIFIENMLNQMGDLAG